MAAPIRILIVDDEPPCRDTIRAFLRNEYPAAMVVGEAATLAEAAVQLLELNPDLVLLDVNLPGGTGFDLLDQFPAASFKVIFTTAHDDFAIRAFRYSAIDYLLKPVDPDLLFQAIKKAETINLQHSKQLIQLRHNINSGQFDRITLNTGDGMVFVQTTDILHLEANGNYTFAFMIDGEKHLVNRNMKEFEEMLPEPTFFRIHQSYLVNTARVKKYLKDDGGYVVMQDGAKLPLARRRKEEFLRELGA